MARPNFSRASRRHRNRLYQSSHPKVAAHGKVHKISGHTRGRNVNVSWFGVTRTPEDAPNTPEDAPVVFCSTFRELRDATGTASIGARIQKLRLAEKYIKYQDTRGRSVNVSFFGVTRTPEDAPNTPEDAPVIFCRYGLAGPVWGPRQRFLRPKTFMPAPVPRVLINSPLVLNIP